VKWAERLGKRVWEIPACVHCLHIIGSVMNKNIPRKIQ
jgi:hypothetical protein